MCVVVDCVLKCVGCRHVWLQGCGALKCLSVGLNECADVESFCCCGSGVESVRSCRWVLGWMGDGVAEHYNIMDNGGLGVVWAGEIGPAASLAGTHRKAYRAPGNRLLSC